MVRCETLIGMRPERVERHLGTADRGLDDDQYGPVPPDGTLIYDLGPQRDFFVLDSMDYGRFYVKFADGRATETFVAFG